MMQKPATTSPILHQAAVQAQPKLLRRPMANESAAVEPGRFSHAPGDAAAFSTQTFPFDMPPAESAEMARQRGFDAGAAEGREQGLKAGRDEGVRQGYEDGFRQGTEQAKEAALSMLQKSQATLQEKEQQILRLLEGVPAAFSRRFEDSEDDMVALVHEAVCRVFGDAFATPEGPRFAVRQAIAQTVSRQLISIRIHPDDFAVLEEIAAAPSLKNSGVSLEPDRRVRLGGCLIDTPEGTIDARLEVQLKKLTELLLKVRAGKTALDGKDAPHTPQALPAAEYSKGGGNP